MTVGCGGQFSGLTSSDEKYSAGWPGCLHTHGPGQERLEGGGGCCGGWCVGVGDVDCY